MTKKETIEQTARELFWKHGFKKVSIDEICKKSNVSRKTFYTYFSNKNSLVIEIMKQITDELFIKSEAITLKQIPFSQKLKQLLELKYLANKNFSIEFVNDFFHPDSTEIMEFFSDLSIKSQEFTRNIFIQAQATGEANPNLNIEFVMWMMQKQMEITSTPEAISLFKDGEEMTKQLSELLIYGIMPIEK